VVTDWAGDGSVKRYKIRFAGMVWPNDRLTCRGTVVRKHREESENLVECELSVVNQNGENAIVGEATVSLPAKR
jgi:acyl dehydratase